MCFILFSSNFGVWEKTLLGIWGLLENANNQQGVIISFEMDATESLIEERNNVAYHCPCTSLFYILIPA